MEKKTFGGAQEGAGRKPKEGKPFHVAKLSDAGRAILKETARRNNMKQLPPALELILRDYATREGMKYSDEPTTEE